MDLPLRKGKSASTPKSSRKTSERRAERKKRPPPCPSPKKMESASTFLTGVPVESQKTPDVRDELRRYLEGLKDRTGSDGEPLLDLGGMAFGKDEEAQPQPKTQTQGRHEAGVPGTVAPQDNDEKENVEKNGTRTPRHPTAAPRSSKHDSDHLNKDEGPPDMPSMSLSELDPDLAAFARIEEINERLKMVIPESEWASKRFAFEDPPTPPPIPDSETDKQRRARQRQRRKLKGIERKLKAMRKERKAGDATTAVEIAPKDQIEQILAETSAAKDRGEIEVADPEALRELLGPIREAVQQEQHLALTDPQLTGPIRGLVSLTAAEVSSLLESTFKPKGDVMVMLMEAQQALDGPALQALREGEMISLGLEDLASRRPLVQKLMHWREHGVPCDMLERKGARGHKCKSPVRKHRQTNKHSQRERDAQESKPHLPHRSSHARQSQKLRKAQRSQKNGLAEFRRLPNSHQDIAAAALCRQTKPQVDVYT